MHIKIADSNDLPALWNIEKTSFNASRRFSFESLKHSLKTEHQDVFVASKDSMTVGYSIVFKHEKSHRIYSMAVDPAYRNMGIGKNLMKHMIETSKASGVTSMTLEADADNTVLIGFYQSFGFEVTKTWIDYYGPNEPAYRMTLFFDGDPPVRKRVMTNVVVTDLDLSWLKTIENITVIDAKSYIGEERYQHMKGIRVFNLCSSYHYQSIGYYVSLLASARLQRVIPNVTTIKDFTDHLIVQSIGDEVHDLIQKTLKPVETNRITMTSSFGYTPHKNYRQLIKGLYHLFESPFLEFTFEKSLSWHLVKVDPIAISDIQTDSFIEDAAIRYFQQKRFNISRFKDYLYDLAILIDPDEIAPPSDRIALRKFKRAADQMGFFTEFITKKDYHRLSEFDALFIRTTTNVNDYTYQFSRYAFAEGLAVIDDPWSILKCSNKLFLTESMRKIGIRIPKTLFAGNQTNLDDLIAELGFPMILKQPDSAFSLGVFQVHDKTELKGKLDELFGISALVVAQAFIPSAFDWRIGILDGKPLFACTYHMARNHWQIINWNSKKKQEQSGRVETYRLEDVPKDILDVATRAACAMGDGLYGVDIKVSNGSIYVIEVNDNPNIDNQTEDRVLKDELYKTVIRSLLTRIENARGQKRNVS